MKDRLATPSELGALLADVHHVLLDFDGPICSIFAGVTPEAVAARLRSVLDPRGVAVPPDIAAASDPFDVLRHAATLDAGLAANVHDALVAEELAAVSTATATAYARDVLLACRDSGRSLAIVSNNSALAVTAYVETKGLAEFVDAIVGRTHYDAALLKPSRHLVALALRALKAHATTTVMVGDSASDIVAARAVGTLSIGYANKPAKGSRLTTAGADLVVESLAPLAAAVRASTSTVANGGR